MVDKGSVRRCFSSSAGNYEKNATVQKKMARRVMEDIVKVAEHREKQEILEVGCGTWYLTGLLLKELESPSILAVDIAPGMIEESRRKFEDVEFICEDIEKARIENRYDLIVSSAAFQWLSEAESTFAKLAGCLKPGGRMVFSTLGSGTFRELDESFKKASIEKRFKIISGTAQGFYSTSELRRILERSAESAGMDFELLMEEKMEYEYFDSSRDFLHSVKSIGASSNGGGLHSPGVVKRAMEIYDKSYRVGEKVRASYHCIYVTLEVRD